MKCPKKEPRTFFNLFSLISCHNCLYKYHDEEILIGNKTINIYHLGICQFDELCDEMVLFDLKLQYLLLSFSLNQKQRIFLWFEKINNLDIYYDFFTAFMDLNMDIYIITH